MRTVTNDFKNTIKQLAVYSDGYVNLVNDNGTLVFDRDKIVSLQIDGSAYRNDKVLGSIAQHSLTLELLGNQTASINLSVENRLQAFVGVLVGSAYEYVQYQDFLVTEVSYTDTTNITRVYATDYLVKLNKEFIDGNDYSTPITLLDYTNSVLTYCGLALENSTFFNDTFSIASKPFEDYTSAKEIIERVAEMALAFVVINKDNGKVEFRPAFAFNDDLMTHSDLTAYTHDDLSAYTHAQIESGLQDNVASLNKDQYWNLKFNDHNFGANGINTLVLGISQVEGENNTDENSTNVAIDGAIEVRILDNPFINTEDKRISVLEDMFDEIDGFKYQPFTVEYRGFPYIEVGDLLVVTKMDNSEIAVPVHETYLRWDGGLKGSLKAKSLNKVITSNKYISKTKQKLRNAEIKVDKVAGEISLLSSEVSELGTNYAGLVITVDSINATVASHDGRISTVEQDVDSITDTIQSVDDDLQQVKTVFQETADGFTITKTITIGGGETKIASITSGFDDDDNAYIKIDDGGSDVAIIQSNNMYIANATISNSLTVGNHRVSKQLVGAVNATIFQKV